MSYTLLKNVAITTTLAQIGYITPAVNILHDRHGRHGSAQAYFATVAGTGAVSATIQPAVSIDGVNWATWGMAQTIAGTNTGLPGSTAVCAAFTQGSQCPFPFFGAYVTAISGTGAAVTLVMDE